MFKNAKPFVVQPGFKIDPELLGRRPSRDIGPTEPDCDGFVEPCNHSTRVLAHDCGNVTLIAWETKRRLLPGSVVSELVKEKAEAFEEASGYKPGRKMMRELKDLALSELLPKSHVVTRRTIGAFFDGFFFVDTSSDARADAMISAISSAICCCPFLPLSTKIHPVSAMAEWLAGSPPAGIDLAGDCVLQSVDETAAQVKYKSVNLDCDEIRSRLASGFLPKKLSIEVLADHAPQAINLSIDEKMGMSRINLPDLARWIGEESETTEGEFDTTAILMAVEIRRALGVLIDAMGGLQKQESDLAS